MHTPVVLLLAGCLDYTFKDHDSGIPSGPDWPDREVGGEAPIDPTSPSCDGFVPPSPYVPALDESCRASDPGPGGFDPVMEWSWSTNTLHPGYEQVMSTPVVANLDDDNGDGVVNEDDSPEIIFTAWEEWYNSDAALTVLRGDGSGLVWSVVDAGGEGFFASGGVAVGDLEGDGSPDICAAGYTHAVVCMEADGTLKWAAGDTTFRYGAPAMADMDLDGQAEVVNGSSVFDSQGNLLGQAPWGTGDYSSLAVPVDLNGDGRLEVVNGSMAFNMDGSVLWGDASEETFPAVADFDGDGVPEVVSTGNGYVVLRDQDGTELWRTRHPGEGAGGPAAIADLDGDGAPEVAVGCRYQYAAFDTDGTVMWTAPIQDVSTGVTGSSAFDFEGDGAWEVVYADEQTLWIFDGRNGAVKARFDGHSSGTIFEYPVVADVDRDGSAEIVVPNNDYYIRESRGIAVVGDSAGSWASARPVWNQYTYHVTNVEDDGGVPTPQVSTWASFRAAWSDPKEPGGALPDLAPGAPTLCSLECGDGLVEIWVPVENRGPGAAGAHTLQIWSSSGTTRHALWTEDLAGLDAVSTQVLGPYRIRADEWGESVEVRVDDPSAVDECQEGNNGLVLGGWPCP